ncbi:MAG: CvpA family protein [candidate division WOR-3 bacterium]
MIDFVFLILIIFFLFKGFAKGFVLQIASLAGIIFGVFLSYKYGLFFSHYFYFPRVFSYVITFLLIYLLFFLTGIILKKFFKSIKLFWLDKILGGAFGFLKAVFLIFLFIFVLKEIGIDLTKKSKIAKEIYKIEKIIKKYSSKNFARLR